MTRFFSLRLEAAKIPLRLSWSFWLTLKQELSFLMGGDPRKIREMKGQTNHQRIVKEGSAPWKSSKSG